MVPCRLISILITLYQGILMSAFYISDSSGSLSNSLSEAGMCLSVCTVTHTLPPEELMIMLLL